MIRRFSYGLLALLLLAACSRESEEVWEGPVIELDLSCVDPSTKMGSNGTEPGENSYHENLIDWVDFYFYPDGVTSAQASYHIRKESGKRGSDVFRLTLTTNQVNYRIFPLSTNTEETLVLALVNVDKTMLDGLSDTSMDAIMDQVVSSDFVMDTQMTNHRQERFYMSGQTTLTLAGRNQKVVSQGRIELERYAAKITVSIKMGDEVRIATTKKNHNNEPVDEVWTPRPIKMSVYLVDGVSNVALSGKPINQDGAATASYLSYRNNPMTFYDEVANIWYFDRDGEYYNTFPMYTYPYHWTAGSEEDNKKEPYLKLVLTWDRQPVIDEGEVLITAAQKEFYYKILIPQDRRGGDFVNTFVRNNWYQYNIEVGVLGGDTDEAEVSIPASAFVVYWQNKEMVVSQAEIGNARYLSLDNDTYELNNQSTADAGYVSSHAIALEVNSVTRPYYGTTAVGSPTLGATVCQANGTVLCDKGTTLIKDIDLYEEGSLYLSYSDDQQKALNGGESWVSDTGTAIHLSHAMDNDYSSAMFDYSPYTILVSLWHKDDPTAQEYAKVLKFIQNPAVFIEAKLNSDSVVNNGGGNVDQENNKTAWQNFEHNGYVFIDGSRRMRYSLVRDGEGNIVKDNKGKNVTADGEYEALQKTILRLNPSLTGGDNGTAHKHLQWLQWRTCNFTGGNRNMYNITVSVLPDDDQVTEDKRFVLGDPRTLEVDNLNNGVGELGEGGSAMNFGLVNPDGQTEAEQYDFGYEPTFSEGTALYGTSPRKLMWYHPAEGGDRTKKMIAPGFRVASKFGGMEFGKADIMAATRKCATYQEDGYPAGRWRLPTYAEINFITTLQAQNTFVVLFGNNTYWSAHGAVTVNNTTHKTSLSTDLTKSALARCVYDSWYWDNMPAPYNRLPAGNARDVYVLGDMPLMGDTE